MCLTSETVWIFRLSPDSFPSQLMGPLNTDLAALIIISRYRRAISAVVFWLVIAVIVPFAFLLVFMIWTGARAFCWKSALLTGDAIFSYIFPGRRMLSSLLIISRLTAILNPDVRAGPGSDTVAFLCNIRRLAVVFDPAGPMAALYLGVLSWTVSQKQASVGADVGSGLNCGFSGTLSGRLSFGCCCSCWRFSGSPCSVVSACGDASSPSQSIPAALSLSSSPASWPGATPFMIFAIIFVMPTPHCLSSSWGASYFGSLSGIHIVNPNYCASSQAACACTQLVRCPTVWCNCISSCTCCRIVLCMRLLNHWRSRGHCSTFSAFCSHVCPSAQIWFCPQSLLPWVSPLSSSPSPCPYGHRSSCLPLLPCAGWFSRSLSLPSLFT